MKTNTLPQADVLHARAAISTIIEPGDGVAGTLIDALGPVAAYDAITGNGLQAALQDAGVGERTAQESISRWTPRISSSAIVHNLAALERANVALIDPDTIPALADLGTQRPVALYVRGNASLLTTSRPITVVGARASTGYGEHITNEIVSDLAEHQVTILSGAAYGIDGAAHRAALAAGIPTVAVVAGGVGRPYPAGHSELIITNAKKAASAAGPSVVDEIVAALDDLVQDPRWDGLMQIRGVNFHQWRPQTVDGGTPKHSMVKQDAAGHDMITVGTRPTNVAPDHELAIAAADAGLDALVEAASRVDQNVFPGLNDMVGVKIFGV